MEGGFFGTFCALRDALDGVVFFVFEKEVFPRCFAFEDAVHTAQIGSIEFARLQGLGESIGRFGAFGDNHESRSVAVEAVHEADIVSSKILAQHIDEILIATDIALTQKPRGLFENNEVGVFKDDLHCGVRRWDGEPWGGWTLVEPELGCR